MATHGDRFRGDSWPRNLRSRGTQAVMGVWNQLKEGKIFSDIRDMGVLPKDVKSQFRRDQHSWTYIPQASKQQLG